MALNTLTSSRSIRHYRLMLPFLFVWRFHEAILKHANTRQILRNIDRNEGKYTTRNNSCTQEIDKPFFNTFRRKKSYIRLAMCKIEMWRSAMDYVLKEKSYRTTQRKMVLRVMECNVRGNA